MNRESSGQFILQIHENRPLFKANAAKHESSEEAKTHLSCALESFSKICSILNHYEELSGGISF